MLRRLAIPLVLLGSLAPVVHAGSIDVNVSNDAARLTYTQPLRAADLELDFGALHSDDDGDVGTFGLHVAGRPGGGRGRSPRVAVGGRLVYVDVEGAEGGGLALGGQVRYSPLRWLTLGGHVYFAPETVSFGDADRYVEFAAHAGYQVHERAEVYGGYRRVRADFEDARDVTVDSGVHFGIRIEF